MMTEPKRMRTVAEMMQIDKRRARAQQLAAHLFRAIEPHLAAVADHRDVFDALYAIVHGEGWDIVTDADRASAGLPPRDEMGWTAAELHALEHARFQQLLGPQTDSIKIGLWPKV